MQPLGYSISEKLQFEKNIPDISLPHGQWKAIGGLEERKK